MALVAAPAARAAPLSIRVEGNHFVNGEGQAIRLLGVNHPSSEYGCVDGFGYDDGHFDDADAAAIAVWNANAVRVPLNEDCWLGLNGQPNSNGGAESTLTADGYRHEIENYVADLNAHGIYAILDLHWTAPGSKIANGQQPMPDDHSAAFWSSVAEAFKGNPAVVFDLFNEPFSPADPRSGEDPLHEVSWSCWRDGGCPVTYYEDNETNTGSVYTAVGMQALVDAVRATGATQPVLVGGLNYADDLTGWLANEPVDPAGQEAASFHNYQGEGKCDTVGCWDSQIAPVAAAVPVVTGEFAQDVCTPSSFDDEYMGWADAHGVSYLAWAWIVLSRPEIEAEGCDAFYLIGDYSGTPASANGVALHDHLLTLPPGGRNVAPSTGGGSPAAGAPTGAPPAPAPRPAPKSCQLTGFGATVLAGGKVRFRLESSQPCRAALAGKTVKAFSLDGRRPRKLGLGTAGVNLQASRPATVTIELPAEVRQLLKAKGSLKGRFTVTLSAGKASTSTQRIVTLRQPKPRKR